MKAFCLKILTFCKRSLARSDSWFLKINWLLFKIRYPSYTHVTCTEILMGIFTGVLVLLHTLQMNHSLGNLITCSLKGVRLPELLIEVSFLQPSVVMEQFLELLCQVLLPQSIINDLLPSPAWVSATQRETGFFPDVFTALKWLAQCTHTERQIFHVSLEICQGSGRSLILGRAVCSYLLKCRSRSIAVIVKVRQYNL